jgi:[acyl-carrier-protein] S-malonyltransferase
MIDLKDSNARMDSSTQRSSRLALIFPGQGSQHTGMGRRVAEASPRARDAFEEASEVLGFDVTRLVLEGSESELRKTPTTQPAILAVSWAHLALLREKAEALGRQLLPSAGSGHSFGQFSAAAAAESLTFADALRLVRERGLIMAKWSQKRPGGMASVIGPSDDDVRGVLHRISPDGDVGVAAVNAPGQTVISGTLEALKRAVEAVKERGGRVVQLPISVPGHFPKMAEAREELRERIDAVTFSDPKFPIVSSLTGRVLTTAEEVRQELSDQMTGAINWMRAFLEMRKAGAQAFFEVGPGNVLSNIAKRLDRDARMIDIFDESQWETVAPMLPLMEPKVISGTETPPLPLDPRRPRVGVPRRSRAKRPRE